MEVKFRRWPWPPLPDEDVGLLPSGSVPFYLSPVIELHEEIRLSRRNDKSEKHGASFLPSPVSFSKNHLLELPLRSRWDLEFVRGDVQIPCSWHFTGLRDLSSGGARELVEAWNRVFDELSPTTEQPLFPWSKVAETLKLIEDGQPERSIIVVIAELFTQSLSSIVSRARKILLRKSEVVRLEKLRETDTRFLTWYVRQSGGSIAEKSGIKREVPGTVRQESFDTLENRVLKHFLALCQKEANQYVDSARKAKYRVDDKRIVSVKRFGELCREQLKREIFADVPFALGPVQANYVLQTDPRYRDVWFWYRKLIRKELEKDEVWSWQGRVWGDVVRLLVGAVFTEKSQGDEGFAFRELKTGYVNIHAEQISGRRLLADTLPGPFHIIQKKQGEGGRKIDFIADFVDPSVMDRYEGFENSNISALGGHLYIVVTPVGVSAEIKPSVIVVWALNRACSSNDFSEGVISKNAQNSLNHWQIRNNNISVYGILAMNSPQLSDSDSELLNQHVGASKLEQGNPCLLLLNVPNHPRNWKAAVDKLKEQLMFILEFACDTR